jgi:hypothetical protein
LNSLFVFRASSAKTLALMQIIISAIAIAINLGK